ncbi:MAG: hypothetical protein AAF490_02445 [Chloroflexota bacterium]
MIEGISGGTYGMQLNPPNSSLRTIRMLENDVGEQFTFKIRAGEELDLGQIEVTSSYIDQ